MKQLPRVRVQVCLLALSLAVGLMPARARAQVPADQQAEMLLTSARKAFNEKNLPFAATRFREFVTKFGGHKEAPAARYGLALSLLDGPEKDRNFNEIQQFLGPLAQDKNFPDQALAAYWLASSFRTQGMAELAVALVNPQEAPQRRQAAQQRFEQALPAFITAANVLQTQAKEPGDKELSPSWEWVARARCDLAETQLRLNKTKEAQVTSEPFLKDPNLTRSRYRDLGRYLYAHAAFLNGDMAAAQKTLTMLAPFANPDFGPHARYLLARTHHVAEERPEATAQYEGALADHKKNVDAAVLMLKEPQRFKNDPAIRAKIEAFLKAPPADHLARSNFHLGVLMYEAGRFAEAKARFQDFGKLFPQSPLKNEADIRIGFCQVQLKDFTEAIKTLQPLIDKDKIGDQATFWLGKAQIGLAPDQATKPQEHKNAVMGALNTLRGAADRAQRLGDNYPEAKTRRGEILLEIGDQLQSIKDNRDSVNVYVALLNDKLLPDREEEITLRLAQAWHLAKDFNESDKQCQTFAQKFPKSTLLSAIAFTFAENNYFRALALEKTPPSPERNKQLALLHEETLKRLQAVLEKYPEYPKILLVRHTQGLTLYRKGEFDKAYKTWDAIPAPERNGDLNQVPFLMADCILRQTPNSLAADADAITTGKLEEQLKTTAELLEGFVGGNPKDASAPDAILKYGLCMQRRAGLLSEVKDKQAALAAARGAYERLLKEFPNHPGMPQAVYERAKVIVQQGDQGGGMNELRRFTTDPLRQAKVAPMAAINLATMLRAQNKPQEAAELLQRTREQHEGPLSQDPTRANWVALLRFHQAAALREWGKLPEARNLFDGVAKQTPKSPEGIESALRLGQTIREEGLQKIEAGRKLIGNPKEAPQGQNLINEGYKIIRDSANYLEGASELLKAETAQQESRARILYEAAWGNRILAEPEVQSAKLILAKEMAQKLGPAAVKLPLPEVSLDKVPLQPSEKKARGIYKTLIDQFGDTPLSLEARFELAELLAQRNEFDPAFVLLNEALDKEPAVDMTEKIRLRIGAVHAAKGNIKAALSQFEAVAQNPKSANLGWAYYRAAEAHLLNKQPGEAVKRLVAFRDNGNFHNIPGLSDRGLLRLSHAYGQINAWPESFQAAERMVNAFPNSPWADEGRFAMGWAMQQLKNHDGAANVYSQITTRTASILAAKAQYQIGTCRLDQKRYADAANAFLVVPTTYDYPELSAASLLEAARAYREINNREQATRLLERVQREYPNSAFAEIAKERMAQ